MLQCLVAASRLAILARPRSIYTCTRLALLFSAVLYILSTPATAQMPSDFEAIARRVYAALPKDRPGFGVTDYPGNTEEHVPKAYAQVLLAELERVRNGSLSDLPSLVGVAGRYLLDHADENHDGVVGWGVPVAWDAYGDESVNPVNAEYTISTAIVADALLSWMEQDPAAPGDLILETLDKAFVPYLKPEKVAPSGLAPYSLRVEDRPYDTYNPAAYLAGEMQRYSAYAGNDEKRVALRKAADRTMQVLLDQHQVSSGSGSWYWNYSLTEDVPNDLGHAAYVIHGIATYKRNGGMLGAHFDLDKVYKLLNEFEDPENGRVRQWPRWRKDIDVTARTYDLGSALSLACGYPRYLPLARRIVATTGKYLTADGRYQKQPVVNNSPNLVVNEYEAYLYRGTVACIAPDQRTQVSGNEIVLRSGAALPPIAQDETKTPFVGLKLADREKEDFRRENLLPVFEGRLGGHAVFLRSLADDGLRLRIYTDNGDIVDEIAVGTAGSARPMFRAAYSDGSQMAVIIYDNARVANVFLRFVLRDGRLQESADPIVLPSLEDPAGATYEMIPKLFVMEAGGQLYILGGTLSARVDGSTLTVDRIADCQRVIEAVSTPFGPAALCARKPQGSPDGRSGSYVIAAPKEAGALILDDNTVPFNLTYAEGHIGIEQAKDIGALRRMFVRDITTSQQSGWMEYGVSNTEGRIAWSQIYYLNGLLDILLLQSRDADMHAVFGPLTKDVRKRLIDELELVNRHYAEGGYLTKAFTVDRSPALFAVQTSRLLLLMLRVREELGTDAPSLNISALEASVRTLQGHIDVLLRAGEPARRMQREAANLAWPKGSKFKYDGVAVPYNHQNEWACAIVRASGEGEVTALKDAQSIVRHFMQRIAPGGSLPATGQWDYWWGTAHDGWSDKDGVSVNTPGYSGDHGKAWISFRTIDSMSLMATAAGFDNATRETAVDSVRALISGGKLYPFANYELVRAGLNPVLSCESARAYARVSSPWEIQNAAWAILRLSKPGC